MGIELYWDNDEQTVMLVEVIGAWTWDEMYEVLHKIKRVTDKSPITLGAILDLTRGAVFPGGLPFAGKTREHGKRVLKMGEGDRGPIAVVGANKLFQTVFRALLSLDPDKLGHIRFVDTMDEAQAFMAEQDFSPRSNTFV